MDVNKKYEIDHSTAAQHVNVKFSKIVNKKIDSVHFKIRIVHNLDDATAREEIHSFHLNTNIAQMLANYLDELLNP